MWKCEHRPYIRFGTACVYRIVPKDILYFLALNHFPFSPLFRVFLSISSFFSPVSIWSVCHFLPLHSVELLYYCRCCWCVYAATIFVARVLSSIHTNIQRRHIIASCTAQASIFDDAAGSRCCYSICLPSSLLYVSPFFLRLSSSVSAIAPSEKRFIV